MNKVEALKNIIRKKEETIDLLKSELRCVYAVVFAYTILIILYFM